MDHPLAVDVYQPSSGIDQLERYSATHEDSETWSEELTSPSRSSSGFPFTNSLMFPFSIHSDTIARWNSFIITPNSGRTFGCRRAFHATASLQNLCAGLSVHQCAGNQHNQCPTPVILGRSLYEGTLTTLTATSWPLCFPFHTSAKPP